MRTKGIQMDGRTGRTSPSRHSNRHWFMGIAIWFQHTIVSVIWGGLRFQRGVEFYLLVLTSKCSKFAKSECHFSSKLFIAKKKEAKFVFLAFDLNEVTPSPRCYQCHLNNKFACPGLLLATVSIWVKPPILQRGHRTGSWNSNRLIFVQGIRFYLSKNNNRVTAENRRQAPTLA